MGVLRQAYESGLITQPVPRHPRFLMALGGALIRQDSKTAATDLVRYSILNSMLFIVPANMRGLVCLRKIWFNG